MDELSVESIYRAMIDDGGMPRLGNSASALGVRKGIDILPDAADTVHRPAFVPGEPNGLSCAPTIGSLPPFLLPVEWGGLNTRTTVWQIEVSELGTDLIAQEDWGPGRKRHISIGPSSTMPYRDYDQAIQGTRTKWKRVTPSKGGP
jgi:hypothetical protein